MKNLNDIFNSEFFKNNIQTEIDAEDAVIKSEGWSRAEIDSLAKVMGKN